MLHEVVPYLASTTKYLRTVPLCLLFNAKSQAEAAVVTANLITSGAFNHLSECRLNEQHFQTIHRAAFELLLAEQCATTVSIRRLIDAGLALADRSNVVVQVGAQNGVFDPNLLLPHFRNHCAVQSTAVQTALDIVRECTSNVTTSLHAEGVAKLNLNTAKAATKSATRLHDIAFNNSTNSSLKLSDMPVELISNDTILIGMGVVLVCVAAYGIYYYYYYYCPVATVNIPKEDLPISSNETLVTSDVSVGVDNFFTDEEFFTEKGLFPVDKYPLLEHYRLEVAHQRQLATVAADARQASIVSDTVKLESDGPMVFDKLELVYKLPVTTSELPTNTVKLLGDHDAYLDYGNFFILFS